MDEKERQLSNWTKFTGMDTEFELKWQKSKDKEFTRLFWNKFQYMVFFPDLSHADNMVRVIEGKIVTQMGWRETKLLRVSGRFQLSRVRVTEGKITVNVWRKSRRNRLWFELAQSSS